MCSREEWKQKIHGTLNTWIMMWGGDHGIPESWTVAARTMKGRIK